MRTATKRVAIGTAALAIAITACVDATRSTSTEPGLYDGARVSLAGGTQVSANINGKLVSSAVHEWAIDGVIKNGVAEAAAEPGKRADNMVMPTLAVSDENPLARSRSNERFATTVTDKARGRQDFVFRSGRSGGPAAAIAHLENGQLAEMYSYDWRKIRGGWVATGFAVTVFKDGKPILTARSGSKVAPGMSSMMVAADDACMFDASYAALSGNCASPPVLYGGGSGIGGSTYNPSAPCSCADQLVEYLNAAWAMGMGTQGAIDTAIILNPITLAALGGGWIYVGYKLYQYNSCVRACASATASTGTAAPLGVGRFAPFDVGKRRFA